MPLADLLLLIRRSRLLLLAATSALGLVGAAAALVAEPVFRSTAQLYISVQPQAPDVSDLAQGNSAAQQKVNSYVQVVRSASVLQPVIEELGLDTTVTKLAEQVSASADVDSVLLDVSVEDHDPEAAQRITSAVASSFTEVVTDQLEKPIGGGTSLVKVETIQPALTPEAPVSPSLPKYTALGLAFGLTVGVVLAVLRQSLDTKIRSKDDIAQVTDAPILGAIAFDPAATREPLVVQSDPHSPRAEAFRTLRTNVQFVEMDEERKSFTVTSALPAEGKSTTAANLAVALSENGARAVLIDADLRRPRVAELMGLEGSAGLTDVLIGRAELDDVTVPWGRGGLRVLPAGQVPPNPSELLGSAAMYAVVEQLTAESDFVIFDAPPLLPVTDAAILTRITGGAIVVSAAGKSTQKQLGAALDALHSVGSKPLGIVTTMVPAKGATGYGTYYAYYRSGPTSRTDRLGSAGKHEGPPVP